MKKILKIRYEQNEYEGTCYQEVNDEFGCRFSVCNLSECPEDAIIGRELFDASDYLRAIRYGIELAKQGYDSVEYVSE